MIVEGAGQDQLPQFPRAPELFQADPADKKIKTSFNRHRGRNPDQRRESLEEFFLEQPPDLERGEHQFQVAAAAGGGLDPGDQLRVFPFGQKETTEKIDLGLQTIEGRPALPQPGGEKILRQPLFPQAPVNGCDQVGHNLDHALEFIQKFIDHRPEFILPGFGLPLPGGDSELVAVLDDVFFGHEPGFEKVSDFFKIFTQIGQQHQNRGFGLALDPGDEITMARRGFSPARRCLQTVPQTPQQPQPQTSLMGQAIELHDQADAGNGLPEITGGDIFKMMNLVDHQGLVTGQNTIFGRELEIGHQQVVVDNQQVGPGRFPPGPVEET